MTHLYQWDVCGRGFSDAIVHFINTSVSSVIRFLFSDLVASS